jgi:hypothetical protein
METKSEDPRNIRANPFGVQLPVFPPPLTIKLLLFV